MGYYTPALLSSWSLTKPWALAYFYYYGSWLQHEDLCNSHTGAPLGIVSPIFSMTLFRASPGELSSSKHSCAPAEKHLPFRNTPNPWSTPVSGSNLLRRLAISRVLSQIWRPLHGAQGAGTTHTTPQFPNFLQHPPQPRYTPGCRRQQQHRGRLSPPFGRPTPNPQNPCAPRKPPARFQHTHSAGNLAPGLYNRPPPLPPRQRASEGPRTGAPYKRPQPPAPTPAATLSYEAPPWRYHHNGAIPPPGGGTNPRRPTTYGRPQP